WRRRVLRPDQGRPRRRGGGRLLRHVAPRRGLSCGGQVSDDLPDLHQVTGLRAVAGEAQNARVDGLDVFGRLLALKDEQGITRPDRVAVALEPLDEGALLHRPAEPRDSDGDCHTNLRSPITVAPRRSRSGEPSRTGAARLAAPTAAFPSLEAR